MNTIDVTRFDHIGRGSYTNAYSKDATTVLLSSCCECKELMAEGKFPNSRYIPKLKKVGVAPHGLSVYEQTKYNDIRDPEGQLIKRDRKIYYKMRELNMSPYPVPKSIRKSNLPPDIKKVLMKTYRILWKSCGYEPILDTHSGNMLEHNGRLILSDCWVV